MIDKEYILKKGRLYGLKNKGFIAKDFFKRFNIVYIIQ